MMGTGKDPRMREALRLVRAGKQEQARQLLIDILRQNRDNFDAWIVMAQVAESHYEAVACMKQALRLRPDDERAARYLEFLLQGKQQTSSAPLSISPWLWGGLGTALVVCVAVALLLVLARPGSQTQTGELGEMSGAQPVADQSADCATLIKEALEVSDLGCAQVGRDQVCYGHDTVLAQLVPGTNPPFERPGNTIPINLLERFVASPLDLQKGEWGVGVFRLEANLPGTLPGQLVTMLIFGDTSIQNTSGDMQAFYFTSNLGGIRCDAIPFDGILVNMADGAGFAFKANGAEITLQGNSILRAVAHDSLVVTALRGAGTIRALGEEQSFGAGQTVTVPMGGSSGLDANGPPSPPQSADNQTIDAGCTLTGQGCPSGGEVAEAAPTNTPAPIDPSIPTNTPVPVAPGQPTNTPVPLPTSTSVPLSTNTPLPAKTATSTAGSSSVNNTPDSGATSTTQPAATSTKTPTNSPESTATTPPPTATTPPPTATTPPPTATTPPPTATTPPPTATVDVCSTIGVSWGGISNKRMTVNITSGAATTLETVQIAWPTGNGNLKKINEQNVDAAPSSTTVAVSIPVSSSTALVFMFAEAAADTGYSITLTFSGGCVKTFNR
jgi:hypothetical protein